MEMLQQRTLRQEVKVTGIGLHSGKKITLRLLPAESDSGIKFRRTDLEGAPEIKAEALAVSATANATTLGEGKNCIHTVEHLLAVLYGLGIDNVICEVDGPEVPIMDGSGASFIFLIKEAGVKLLSNLKNFMVILEPVRVEVGDRWAEISPHEGLVINSTINFPHPLIQKQAEEFKFTCENFISSISRARTFGMLKDVDALKEKGLIKGASLNNAIVLDDFKVINDDGLRFDNEFVRHKILDTLGDLALLGNEVCGKITTYCSGHYLHNLLCRKIIENPSCYELVEATSLAPEFQEAFELPLAILHSR